MYQSVHSVLTDCVYISNKTLHRYVCVCSCGRVYASVRMWARVIVAMDTSRMKN